VQQRIGFSNAQSFDIVGDANYRQQLTQTTSIDTVTTVNTGVYDHVLTEHRDWPLSVDYAFDVATDGSAAQVTTIQQGLNRAIDVGIGGYEARTANLAQYMTTTDTLLFDAGGNATGRTQQGSEQGYAYDDPFGACYSRKITTASGALTAIEDGAECPSGNTLTWFDAFYNAASSIFGATVQILP
jgi:hypothetical protein